MDLLFNVAASLAVISFMFRKVLYIRLVSILSSILYIQYSVNHQLPDIFWWSLVYIFVNTVQIICLIRDQLPGTLQPPFKSIKDRFFAGCTTAEFQKILKMAKTVETSESHLIRKNAPVNHLMLLLDGTAYVQSEGATFSVDPYHFLGEMSFFNNNQAVSDVYIHEPVKFLSWDYKALYKLKEKNPPLFMKFVEAIGKDIVLKLIIKNAELRDMPTISA